MAGTSWVPPVPLGDQVQDQKSLHEALERRLTRPQLQALRQAQQILRDSAAKRQSPELALQSRAPQWAQTSELAIRPVQHSMDQRWELYCARSFQRAEEEGLVRRGEHGTWHCPYCEKEVDEGHLESHMESNRHVRYKTWHQDQAILEHRYAEGELPRWIEIRGGIAFCRLCDTSATEAHMHSKKHLKALEYHESLSASTAAPLALPAPPGAPGTECWERHLSIPASEPGCIVSEQQLMAAQPFPLPQDWGDPVNFEWQAERGGYFCKLCWKNADEAHVYSQRHVARVLNNTMYVEGSSATAFGATPQPSSSRFPLLSACIPACASQRVLAIEMDPAAGVAAASSGRTCPEYQSDVVTRPAPSAPQAVVVTATAVEPLLEDVSVVAAVVDAHCVQEPAGGEALLIKEDEPDLPEVTELKDVDGSGEGCRNAPSRCKTSRWEKFAVDDKKQTCWWWCESDGACFLESNPGSWNKYMDPMTDKIYWWRDDENWFWEHSGSSLP